MQVNTTVTSTQNMDYPSNNMVSCVQGGKSSDGEEDFFRQRQHKYAGGVADARKYRYRWTISGSMEPMGSLSYATGGGNVPYLFRSSSVPSNMILLFEALVDGTL